MVMMEKFSALKLKNLELIDLDRITGPPEYAQEYVGRFFGGSRMAHEIDHLNLLVINNTNDRVCTPPSKSNDHDEFDYASLEDLDWSDIIDAMNNTSDRVCTLSDSNDHDDSSKNIGQKNIRYTLSEFSDQDDLSFIINQY